MRFITAVRITDFRSIADASIDALGDITPIVGLNGSGKSNLLRALNLLFTGFVEDDIPINLRRDFREPGRAVKLRVVVEADLDFGVFARLRREYVDALQHLAHGSRRITVQKEWTLDPVTREAVTTVQTCAVGGHLSPVRPEDLPFVTRLLGSIRFRYVPNHIHPSRILGDEEAEIRRILFERLGKRQVLQEHVVTSIGEVATEVMAPVLEVMSNATGEVAAVELATPRDWRDLAWTFGMRMRGSQSQSFDAALHGSGVQSILAYAILHAVDTSFSGTFGWRKGAIWAVEEPESFLHVGLQEELARMLSMYTGNDAIQVLLTTHVTPFLGVGSAGLVSRVDSSGRTELETASREELLRVAFTTRISPYSHALHSGPPKPMLLVEGTGDRDLILRAFRVAEAANPFDIRALSDLAPELTGGDDVVRWLKYNAAALNARPETSPVFVLRDWETGPKVVSQIEEVLSGHATSRCLVWPEDLVNPDLSRSFVGIERFLSTAFVEHASQTLGLHLTAPVGTNNPPAWRYDTPRAELNNVKSAIHADLRERDDPADLMPLVGAIPWLSRQLTAIPTLL